MKRLALLAALLFASALCAAQQTQARSGTITVSGGTASGCFATPPTAGACFVVANKIGALAVSFEEIPNGSPSSVSTVVYGCMTGGTCDSIDTNTATSAAIRGFVTTKAYSIFLVVSTFSGGTSPSITVNYYATTS
jgi:hypothetical protein